MRRILIVLLIGAVLLSCAVSALAQGQFKLYELQDYEEIIGKELEFGQAPQLRVKVAAGELPPVEERLPEEPLVVNPIEEIGEYGGVWRQVHTGRGDLTQIDYHLNENLVKWSADFTEILPNVAKSWEFSEDARTVTFSIRKGIKWSDGVPFTVDDIMFWWEKIILNDDISPRKPSWLKSGGELATVEKIDDYTVEFSFALPYATILSQFVGSQGGRLFYPEHYLKQFHPDYTSMDKIEKMMEEEDYVVWANFFNSKIGKWIVSEKFGQTT